MIAHLTQKLWAHLKLAIKVVASYIGAMIPPSAHSSVALNHNIADIHSTRLHAGDKSKSGEWLLYSIAVSALPE